MEHACGEFGINPRTLSGRIKQLDILAGEDRCYSTKQIATAVYGDLERERIRLTSAEADSQERENLVELGQLIAVEEFQKSYATIYVDMTRLIRGSTMTETEQDALLTAMTGLHQPK